MRLANPAALWLLTLAIPILLLHVLRPARRAVAVSSTFLWEQSDRPVSAARPWQRLRSSWLLLLQLLALLALTVAVADPVRDEATPLAAHTVFIVDASASMQAVDGSPDRLAAAKDRAEDLREDLPAGGTASIVVASDRPAVLLSSSSDAAAFSNALRPVQAGDGAADFEGAFTLAAALDTGAEPIGFVLLSDGGLRDEDVKLAPLGTRYERVGDRAANRAIVRLSVEPRGSGLHARAVVMSTGGPAVDQPIRFDVDGVTVAQAEVHLEPGESATVEVDLPPGTHIEARLDGDDLLDLDDVARAIAPLRAEIKVLLAGEDTFLAQALEALPDVTVEQRSTGDVATGFDVAIYNQVAVPGDPGAPFIAIASPGGATGVTPAGTVPSPVLSSVKSDDPLLEDLDLSEVLIDESQLLELSEGAVAIVGGETTPLVVRGEQANHPFAYLGFALGDSDLPFQIAFPVLVDRLVTQLGRDGIDLPSFTVGQQLPVDHAVETTVHGPGGVSYTVRPGAPPVVADRPGYWTLEVDGLAPQSFAVNADPTESDLAPRSELAIPEPEGPQEHTGAERAVSLLTWFVLALLAIVLVEWLLARRTRAVPRRQWRAATAVRLGCIALALLALVDPVIHRRGNQVSTAFVLDASASLGPGGRQEAAAWVRAALAEQPEGARSAVILVGGDARLEQPLSDDPTFVEPSVRIDATATNLASGLRLGAAVLPDDTRKRVVVVSDGRATRGDTAREAEDLGRRELPADTHLVLPATGPDASLAAFEAPAAVRAGELVPIKVTVRAAEAGPAVVRLERDGVEVDRVTVDLVAGDNEVMFADEAGSATGLVRYRAVVERPGDPVAENDVAFGAVPVEGPARVLLVEGVAGEGTSLAAALRAGGVEVDVIDVAAIPDATELGTYAATVLVDVDARFLDDRHVQAIASATRDLGKGLVTVGGPRSYGVGGYRGSALEELLPVESEIQDPQRRQRVAQVLSIDTSGSMAACHCSQNFDQMRGGMINNGGVNKTEISRAAAARVISSLSANDEIGVLAWNQQSTWVIDLQPTPSEDVVTDGLAKLRPEGSTDLLHSLDEAAEALRESNASLKHIILFTDGFTTTNNFDTVADQAAALAEEGITVSVLATGETFGDATEGLEKIAESGRGRFYPGTDLDKIPDIMADEAVLASRDFINEGDFVPEVTSSSEVVAPLTAAPALSGYIATTARPTADTMLRIGPDRDPLLATWRTGLGTATSWTSDAGAQWASSWASWDGYVDYWNRVVKATFPTGSASGAVTAQVVDGRLRVTVRGSGAWADGAEGAAKVASPDGQSIDVPLERVDATTFVGEVPVNAAGVYAVGAVVSADDSPVFGSSALATQSYAEEFEPAPADAGTLTEISRLSGGRADVQPEQVWDRDGLRAGVRRLSLGPWLLLLAAVLWPVAVALSRLTRATALVGRPRDTRVSRASGWARRMLRPPARPGRTKAPAPRAPERARAEAPVPPPPPPPTPLPTRPAEPERPTTIGSLLEQKRGRRSGGGPPSTPGS